MISKTSHGMHGKTVSMLSSLSFKLLPCVLSILSFKLLPCVLSILSFKLLPCQQRCSVRPLFGMRRTSG